MLCTHSRIRTCRGPDLRETRDLLTEAVATLYRLSNAQVSTQPATNAAAGQPDQMDRYARECSFSVGVLAASNFSHGMFYCYHDGFEGDVVRG